MSKVIWKKIENFPDYEVSTDGFVRSIERKALGRWGALRRLKGRLIKAAPIWSGYMKVSISKDGKNYPRSVHRLVAKAFIPNPRNLPQVNHINCVKDDNRVENLEWVNAFENFLHAAKNGRYKNQSGDNHHCRKVNDADAEKIKMRWSSGETQISLASEYGVTQGQISRIVHNLRTHHNKKYNHLYV